MRDRYPAPIRLVVLAGVLLLGGCATAVDVTPPYPQPARLSPRTSTYTDLKSLPAPRGKIVASVYNFRDQTGQYRPVPASSFSTAVTQGAAAMLVQALNDSGWFITLEREGLQNLLTERKIIRAALKKPDTPDNNSAELPSLLAANVLFEGGIVSYDTNTRTGGVGARYLGIGGSELYTVDQVTVNLRAIDIRTGRILNNVSTTKTVVSKEIQAGVFKFIAYKELLEMELGTTTNEPTDLCVRSAIEAAVAHIIVDGLKSRSWELKSPDEISSPIIKKYLEEEPAVL